MALLSAKTNTAPFGYRPTIILQNIIGISACPASSTIKLAKLLARK
jgi:hypothetical protein